MKLIKKIIMGFRCKSLYCFFFFFWMSRQLHSAALGVFLHFWHLKKKCCLKAGCTPSRCSRLKENNRTTAFIVRYHGNWFDFVQQRRSGFFCSMSPCRSIRYYSWLFDTLMNHPNDKTTTDVCFSLMGVLKWWYAWRSSPSLPLRECATTGMTRCTGTWETQRTLLPWLPSQRITVLQRITPPTALAASEICSSSFCCVLLWWEALADSPTTVIKILLLKESPFILREP